MAKTFKDYLTGSTKTFEFKLWFSNVDLTSDELDKLEVSLQKYKLENISRPKTQPITKDHQFFPGHGAVELSTVEVMLGYPCNATQVHDAVVRSGMQLAGRNLVVLSKSQAAGQDVTYPEYDQYPPKDALLNSTYDASNYQDGVGEKHKESFLKSLTSRKFEFAGATAEKAKTTNDIPQGNTSPVGTNKTVKPALQRTGAK